ncbi:MAG: hypothetical protein MUO85_03780 [candidate division Zixibacteria bacterium]|nr:hypothetical protein [candidate division Zixibacteria bacterium]
MFSLEMFNDHLRNNQTLIEKALTTAANSGGALIPESLEKQVTNILQRLTPEFNLLFLKKIASNQHKYNRYTALPGIGGAMGESGTTPVGQSVYTRLTVDLKEVRRKGRVTDFLADASEEVIDAVSIEVENNLTAHIHDLVNYALWGNEYANVYEFSGLDFYIGALTTTNHYNRVVKARYGVVPTSLKDLDDMIDYSNRKGGNQHPRVFEMSPELASLFSRLTTNIHDHREVKGRGVEQVLINGGWRLWAYRDIPIIETTSTSPQRVSPTPTCAVAGTGSGLGGATTLYFRIAEETKNGEELASAEVSQAITTADTIALSWTPNVDANGVAEAYRYRIYCTNTAGGGANLEKLVKIIPGLLYTSGAVSGNVSTVTFSTNPAVADPTISLPSSFAGIVTTVPAHMRDDIPLEKETAHGVPEIAILWDIDPIQGLGKIPYTNRGGSKFNGLVTSEPLAKVDAWRDFLLRSTLCLTPAFEGTSYMVRGMRTY